MNQKMQMPMPAAGHLAQKDKINRSKLKRDCIHYVIAVHGIACCITTGKPKLFTTYDQCVGCDGYVSSNKNKS